MGIDWLGLLVILVFMQENEAIWGRGILVGPLESLTEFLCMHDDDVMNLNFFILN